MCAVKVNGHDLYWAAPLGQPILGAGRLFLTSSERELYA